MKSKLLLALILLATTCISSVAQKSKEKIELKVFLRDGGVITGVSESIYEVALKTDYGELKIPVKNINTISFGIGADKAISQKVKGLLTQLEAADEETQRIAYEQMVDLEVNAIPVIREYIDNKENVEEGAVMLYSAESIYSFLKAKFGLTDAYSDKDEITMDLNYKMGGIYDIKEINIKTEYGVLTIPKYRISRIEVVFYDLSGSAKSFQLMASINISSNSNGGWLNTGIQLKTGQSFSITATGQIVLASLSNGAYGPDGKYAGSYEGELSSDYPQYGNVVFKIGEQGSMIKAGAKYNGQAKNTGVLYLSIYETVYNQNNSGAYNVRVIVK